MSAADGMTAAPKKVGRIYPSDESEQQWYAYVDREDGSVYVAGSYSTAELAEIKVRTVAQQWRDEKAARERRLNRGRDVYL